jgi:topoisomerase IA-like protein
MRHDAQTWGKSQLRLVSKATSNPKHVKHGDVNAILPKYLEPNDLTLDQAIALLAAREQHRSPRIRARRSSDE